MIGIVVDGAASMDPSATGDGVVVVPMEVEIDGRPVGGRASAAAKVAQIVSSGGGSRLQTAAPSPGAFVAGIEEADHGDGVVVLTVSSRMSSSFEAATLAARLSGRAVEVVDTGTAAGAEGLVGHAALREAHSGASLEAVAKHAQWVSGEVRLVAEVGDLRQLAHGGRLPARLAGLGNAVGLRPVFQYRRGSIRVLRPALSDRAAREALVSALRSTAREDALLHLAVSYATDRAAAESLLEAAASVATPTTAYAAGFGPVMIAHTGTEILGLSWYWEPRS